MDRETEGFEASDFYQARGYITEDMMAELGNGAVGAGAATAVAKRLKAKLDTIYICYAHQLHMFRGGDVTKPDKRAAKGYAPKFEQPTTFPGRMAAAAGWSDLFGKKRDQGEPGHWKPWLDGLPRLIFVSDMGDALSKEIGFDYLEREIIDVVGTDRGRRHLWLWLTKLPRRMAEFAESLDAKGKAWPTNLVAMTTATSQRTADARIKHLLKVPARFRGLSVEPLWEDVRLPLEGIDLCIVGGQSGPGSKPFDLAWARGVQKQCRQAGTAFFLKQLGARPVVDGMQVPLKDGHGGDWDEWPADLRVRQMPQGFSHYRGKPAENLIRPAPDAEAAVSNKVVEISSEALALV